MFRFLKRLAALALGLFGWCLERGMEWCTRRNFAAERAEAADEERRQLTAANDAREAEARHDELLAATERQTLETRKLHKAIAAASPLVDKPKSLADRRKEIEDQSDSHNPEIRSSRWVNEPEADAANLVKLRVA